MTNGREAKVLVVGATGTVGGEAVKALLAKRADVRALVRSPERARDSSLSREVELVKGDLNDESSVRRALSGVDAAIFVAPHEPAEEQLAETFVGACEAAGVRLVFIGVHVDGATRIGRALKRFVYGRIMAHYAPKFRMSERARRSSADPVVLVATNFFQNDEMFREDILEGLYTQPFGERLNRVDVRDLGEAAARASLDPTVAAGAYPVIGPASLDGIDCAAEWSAALGHPVRYVDDPARFEASIARALHGKKREDFSKSYAVLKRFAIPTDPKELTRTTALLGRAPTAYATYVREMARAWQPSARRSRASDARAR